MLLAVVSAGAQNKETMTQNENVAGVLKAIELYAEAGRQASREIGEQAFTKDAIMSWVENGNIVTVPINALFDVLGQTGTEEVTYEVSNINIADDVAYVRIESWFSKLGSFSDMFTLARQGDEWKIVSKIYHAK